jgi:hypothetical protein
VSLARWLWREEEIANRSIGPQPFDRPQKMDAQ